MVTSCCLPDCRNTDSNVSKRAFPVLHKNIYNIWIERVGIPKIKQTDPLLVAKRYRLCDRHFSDHCKLPGERKLKFGSLPTLHLPSITNNYSILDVGKTNENDSSKNNNTAVSNNSNVENKKSLQSNNNIPIDLPNVSTQVKNNITLPDPLEIEPVEKVTYSILAKELTSKSRVTSSIQNKYIDDDIQIIETNDVVIDLCDDETNDAAPADDTISIPETVDNDTATQDTSTARKDTFSLTPDNLGMICRTCLKQKDVVNLHEHKYEEVTFADILEMCAPIKLKDDTSLSQNICKTCINELLQTYHFRLKCEKSEQILSTFKTELAKSQARKKCLQDRYKNLSLRFHDYESILNEEDVQQITHPKRHDHDISTTETVFPKDDKTLKKRFYLVKGCADGKTGLDLSEIDENNAKALMNDTGQAAMTVRVGNAVCNLTKGVLQPGQEITDAMKDNLKNALVRNLNKRKMIAYSQLIKPAIRSIMTGRFTPNACLLRPKKPKKPRKRKISSDKPKYRKPVIPGVCETCNEPLNTMNEYKEHVKVTKHYLNPHICKECGNVYGDRYRLKTHWLINHQENKLHMCDICGKCYKTRNYLNLHLKSHSNVNKRGEYVCKQCGNIYGTFRDLITHKRKVHPSIEKEHCCEYCGDFFSSKGTLRHHRNRVHLKIKHEFCQICGKGFLYKSNLKKHMSVHSTQRFDCTLCNKTFKLEHRYLTHIETQHPGTDRNTKEEDEITAIECDYCEKSCRNKQLYSMHIREDHEAPMCIYCDTMLETLLELEEHAQSNHSEIPNYSCRYCGKCFSESLLLYSHLDVHKPKFYQCSLCWKKFSKGVQLQKHMVFHTREKLYTCHYCDKSFMYSSSLVIHERVHTGERPYVCDICGKGNICASSYKKHRRTHITPIPIKADSINVDDKVSVESVAVQYGTIFTDKKESDTFEVMDTKALETLVATESILADE
ncbi:zinc finger protein [Holotrichia oblita]|uniref:Zinc finger protein n=1 Tax=Holotrichia oblita TaxID=644536 RepID=A0ACB9T609_HOLOL|nr:zinc finger protein [Holotrichia oblita]